MPVPSDCLASGASAKPQTASDTPGRSLRLSFTGDVCLGRGVIEAHPGPTVESVLAGLRMLFAGSDLVMGNLEFAVAPRAGACNPSVRAMTVAPHLLSGLGKGPFQVFSLANNHVMDAGPDGLNATLGLLRQEGLAWLGAGDTYQDAVRPLVLEVKGRRLGLLAACDWSPHFARQDAAGIAPLRARELERRVTALRAQCDVVVVQLHADLEFTPHPAPWRIRLARRLVDHGAHAVIQHHPHVIQGWERRGEGVIAYSLGNFVFRIHGNRYQGMHAGTLDGLALHLQVEFGQRGEGVRLTPHFVPVRIGTDHLPGVPSEPERARILAALARASAELREPRRVRTAWRRRAALEAARVAYGMYADAARGGLGKALRAPLRVLRHPEDRRWLWGWLSGGYW
jgi:hypothetical protein